MLGQARFMLTVIHRHVWSLCWQHCADRQTRFQRSMLARRASLHSTGRSSLGLPGWCLRGSFVGSGVGSSAWRVHGRRVPRQRCPCSAGSRRRCTWAIAVWWAQLGGIQSRCLPLRCARRRDHPWNAECWRSGVHEALYRWVQAR